MIRWLVLWLLIVLAGRCTRSYKVSEMALTRGAFCDYANEALLEYRCEFRSPNGLECANYIVRVAAQSDTWQWEVLGEGSTPREYYADGGKYGWHDGTYLYSQHPGDTLDGGYSQPRGRTVVDSARAIEIESERFVLIASHYTYTHGHLRTELWHPDIGMVAAREDYAQDSLRLLYTLGKVTSVGISYEVDTEDLRAIIE